MATSRWLYLPLLGCSGLLAACDSCHSPLTIRRDAGQAADVRKEDAPADLPSQIAASPDLATDRAPDLAPADLAAREASAPDLTTLGVPKAFRFVNHTNSIAYVRVDSPVGCRRQIGSGWQECSFFGLWCMVTCSGAPMDGHCCEECEQGLPSLYAIGPGQDRSVPWNGHVFTKDKGICRECECQIETPVQSGSLEASASVYADYLCSPMPSHPCLATPDGKVEMADPRGSSVALAVPFSVPYPGDEVVLDIFSLPTTDAGAGPDLGADERAVDAAWAADTSTSLDVFAPVDRQGGNETADAQDAVSCQALAYTYLGLRTGPRYCPVDPSLPECASSDVRAIVYRDEACALATYEAHPDCAPWQRPLDSEFVFVTDPFGGCNWPITIDSVRDCGDHVDIDYSVNEPCGTCDAILPASAALLIPNDPKPVRATATLVRPRSCP